MLDRLRPWAAVAWILARRLPFWRGQLKRQALRKRRNPPHRQHLQPLATKTKLRELCG